ncbi:XRE family transcriptional regulator [Pseudaminobacter sp. 19-2017]|uniref:XRE family transcriptional regulator n=1 Tax=Pseudaminobacter soli (ex Zhang et al. 2022) TaxID=2831468 RepID=A0A942E0A3_9HYPH|nr:XRE family transcriptional regulator [Pseudaminobacter soli]MBS3648475.1 XRE family transcriptional regulator [Pseudaminobacter soli]
MLTGSQCRAARALVEWTRETLARSSGVDTSVIEAFERKLGNPDVAENAKLQRALEAAGAYFIAENGGGVGVRLKFSRTDVRRLSILEGEGGTAAMDDVP